MEKAEPTEFQVEKLQEWFQLNIRTLQHIHLDEVAHTDWIAENKHVIENSRASLPLPPLKYDPHHFLKKGEANYASRTSKIILHQKLHNEYMMTNPKAFEEYGLNADEMAKVYDKIDKKNQSAFKDPGSYRTSFDKRPLRLNSLNSSMQTQRRNYKNRQDAMTPMSENNQSTDYQTRLSHQRFNTLKGRNENTLRPGFLSSF